MSRKGRRFVARVVVLLAVVEMGACVLRTASAQSLQEKVDRQVRPLIEGQAIVGCVVGVLQDGKTEFFGYGEIERGSGKQPHKRTIYEIGSISKAFTGTLLAEMSLRGEVSLDDPLQKYVPTGTAVPQHGDKPITLRHLVTHTSGLPRLPDNMSPANPADPYADYTAELAYAFLASHELRRPPGESEYSNFGMGLLGQVLADRTGTTYEKLLVERITRPLDMRDTRISLRRAQQRRFAPPYRGDRQPDTPWMFDALAGAGAIRSTAHDLLKLAEAAIGDRTTPVRPALDRAFEKVDDLDGDQAMGLGWLIARDGVTRWHNGQTGGYSSALYIVPPRKLAVVMLTNVSTGKTTEVAEKITQAALGIDVEPIQLRKEVVVANTILQRYVGEYQLAPQVALDVTLEGDQLMVQITGQPKLPVFAESATKFFYKMVDAQITFEATGGNRAHKLTLHQNGLNMPAPRVGAKQPVAARTEVTVDPATLQSYVGRYAIVPEFVLNVTLDDGQLTIQATGQGKLPFYPESKTKFFCKLVDAQISFVRNVDGAIDKLILHQNGVDQTARRLVGDPQAAAPPRSYENKSPFTAVRWRGERPEVRVDGDWFQLVSLNDIPTGEVVAFSRQTFGPRWQMRFEEDLVELLTRMGNPPGDTVRLVVSESGSNRQQTLNNVAMTEENRWKIKDAADARRSR